MRGKSIGDLRLSVFVGYLGFAKLSSLFSPSDSLSLSVPMNLDPEILAV